MSIRAQQIEAFLEHPQHMFPRPQSRRILSTNDLPPLVRSASSRTPARGARVLSAPPAPREEADPVPPEVATPASASISARALVRRTESPPDVAVAAELLEAAASASKRRRTPPVPDPGGTLPGGATPAAASSATSFRMPRGGIRQTRNRERQMLEPKELEPERLRVMFDVL